MTRRPSRATVKLRTVRKGDLTVFYEQQRDPVANSMAAFPAREHGAFMTHWHKIMRDPANALKTILYGREVAGNVVSFMRGDTREIGYWLGKEFWGKGIATEALSLFLRRVKSRPLYAGVYKHNIASIRVLEKCGFVMFRPEGEDFLLILS